MTVQCIECINWRPRETEKSLVTLGLAVCSIHTRGAFHAYGGTYRRDCAEFTLAEAEVIAARRRFDSSNRRKVTI